MQRSLAQVLAGAMVLSASAFAARRDVIIVDFPDPAYFYQNTTFAESGDVGFVPSYDNDVLWSFSFDTGALLDPDGLPLPAPGTASDGFLFPGDLLAITGWFPDQGVFVADVSDPADLRQHGIIPFGSSVNIQGQNIEVDENGVIGYVASFPNDTLYSFNVQTMTLEDPDGLALPGNPDRIGLAGDRLAMVDTDNGRILVADVSDPADLALAGIIDLPHAASFGSNDNIVFADDDRTGFVSSNERYLYSFDVLSLSVVDPDGLQFGTQQFGDHIARHRDLMACIYSRGLTFVDISDPADMMLISDANFGGTVAPQGSATVAFSSDGSRAAIPVIYPDMLVYAFDVATGEQIADPLPVDDQPNYLMVRPDNVVGVLCSGNEADNIWLISDLLPGIGDVDGDGDVDTADLLDLLAAWGDCPPPPQTCPADLDGDGDVDTADLLALLANWG
ncbi:MAG: hypothetical protein SYC29_07545 [Planctomycetota bacterium]|nr:hypothetical protein [Planctomycetota bacterium]